MPGMAVLCKNSLPGKKNALARSHRRPRHGKIPPIAILSGLFQVAANLISFFLLFLRPTGYRVAENLFLRKQLAFYQERKIKHRRIAPASKLSLILLSKLFDCKEALVIVQPATLIRWHREAFELRASDLAPPGPPVMACPAQGLS